MEVIPVFACENVWRKQRVCSLPLLRDARSAAAQFRSLSDWDLQCPQLPSRSPAPSCTNANTIWIWAPSSFFLSALLSQWPLCQWLLPSPRALTLKKSMAIFTGSSSPHHDDGCREIFACVILADQFLFRWPQHPSRYSAYLGSSYYNCFFLFLHGCWRFLEIATHTSLACSLGVLRQMMTRNPPDSSAFY